MQGWISLHRSICDNPMWLNEPFTKGQAWVDLLMLANHKDTVIYKRGIKIIIKRGEVGWSEEALAARWRWSRGKVRRYKTDLETVQQIVQQNNKTLSRILIVNYEKYQQNGTTNSTNDNNVNNINNNSETKVSQSVSNLIENKENMGWNNSADDYEEGVVDADGDGSVKSTAPVSKAKYPHAPEVRKIFLRVLGRNPANWKVNRTELQACENLYIERGIEKIETALNYYKENQDKEFIPTIDSPHDLDSKWTKLGKHKIKHES